MTLSERIDELKRAAASGDTSALQSDIAFFLTDELCETLMNKALYNNNPEFIRSLLSLADESRRFLTCDSLALHVLSDALEESRGKTPHRPTVKAIIDTVFERQNGLDFLSRPGSILSSLINAVASRGWEEVAEQIIDHVQQAGEVYTFTERDALIDEVITEHGYDGPAYLRAARRGNVEGLKTLQKFYDRDIDFGYAGDAAKNGHEETVEYILDQLDDQTIEQEGSILLTDYLENGHEQPARRFVDSMPPSTFTPYNLEEVVRQKAWDVVPALLEKVELKSSPIRRAAGMGTIRTLLEVIESSDCDVEVRSDMLDEALQTIVRAAITDGDTPEQTESTVRFLLEQGASPGAILYDEEELVDLVESNADEGLSEQRRAGLVDQLCRHAEGSLNTPIIWTMRDGSPSALKVLFEHDEREQPACEQLFEMIADAGPSFSGPMQLKAQLVVEYARPTRESVKRLHQAVPSFYEQHVKPGLNRRERLACET